MYSNQTWYQDAPLYSPTVQGNQIWHSRFMAVFVSMREIRGKKKLSQFLKSDISGMLVAILLKFGVWTTDIGGHVHSKYHVILLR